MNKDEFSQDSVSGGCVLFGTFFKSFSVCHQNECILFIALDCGDFYSGYALMLVDFVKLFTLDRNKYKTVNWNYFEIRDRVKRKGKREDMREKCGRTAWKVNPYFSKSCI